MRRYGESRRMAKDNETMAVEIVDDFLALLLCIGFMVGLLFLAGGM